MNLPTLMQSVVQQRNKFLAQTGSRIRLSLPVPVSSFYWHDRSLEKLLRQLTSMASLAVDSGKPVHIAVSQKKKMRGLETFFRIQPSHWIQLRITGRGPAGFEKEARQLLADLGYYCEEWIGADGSWPQLGAYSTGRKGLLKLVFVARWQRNTQTYELLIPIAQPLYLANTCKRPVTDKTRNSAVRRSGMRSFHSGQGSPTKGPKLSEARRKAGRAIPAA